jgi:Xaa-Pro aminopeptidase
MSAGSLPFDGNHLDRLLAGAGIDAVLATSGHATRHLLGGYRFFLYETLDGIGRERYLPALGYVAGRRDQAFYIGAGNEAWGLDPAGLWPAEQAPVSWTAADAVRAAAERLRAVGLDAGTIGVELPYLTADAWDALRAALPNATFVDAGQALEDLRAVKSGDQLALVRAGATAVVDAMLATFAAIGPGTSEAEAVERLRLEETRRGLVFGYCLIASGSSVNRAPTDRVLRPGDVISLDSGAHFRGYVADLTRMGIIGAPGERHRTLLGQVAAVQSAARAAAVSGAPGREIFDAAERAIAAQPDGDRMVFLAHGTGLLSHEAPRLTDTGSPPYPATHRDQPLEAGMVLSIETHLIDPDLGFIKLEDTVIVADGECEPCGDHGRGWNVVDG